MWIEELRAISDVHAFLKLQTKPRADLGCGYTSPFNMGK